MTKEETGAVMDIIATAYPRFYANQSKEEKQHAIALWALMFSQESVEEVAAAVKLLVANNTFPPVIAEVKEAVLKVRGDTGMDEYKAWEIVKKTLEESYYHPAKGFRELPDEIRQIVGSPSRLREWGMMDFNTLNTVIASNFMRMYRSVATAKKERQTLPIDVKMLMDAQNPKELESGV